VSEKKIKKLEFDFSYNKHFLQFQQNRSMEVVMDITALKQLYVEKDTPCTSILLVVERDTPCTSVLPT
jgi:hypothetical protein